MVHPILLGVRRLYHAFTARTLTRFAIPAQGFRSTFRCTYLPRRALHTDAGPPALRGLFPHHGLFPHLPYRTGRLLFYPPDTFFTRSTHGTRFWLSSSLVIDFWLPVTATRQIGF